MGLRVRNKIGNAVSLPGLVLHLTKKHITGSWYLDKKKKKKKVGWSDITQTWLILQICYTSVEIAQLYLQVVAQLEIVACVFIGTSF